MARDLDASILSELPKGAVQVALLAALDFDTGWVRVWSGIGNLIYDGETYQGIGYLGEIAPITESGASVSATAITLNLSGIPSSLLSVAFTSQYQGRKARVWLGFFDTAWALLECVLLFAGRMDTMVIDEGPETSTITVSAESHLADLKRPRVRRYTNADQQEMYPGDRGLEFIESIQNVEVAWGPGSGGGTYSTPPVLSSGTSGGGSSPNTYAEPGGGDGGPGSGDNDGGQGPGSGQGGEGTGGAGHGGAGVA